MTRTLHIATAIIEFESGLQTRLQQVAAPFHREFVFAGAQSNLCRHDLEHIVHHLQQIDRLGGQNLRQPPGSLLFQFLPCSITMTLH